MQDNRKNQTIKLKDIKINGYDLGVSTKWENYKELAILFIHQNINYLQKEHNSFAYIGKTNP